MLPARTRTSLAARRSRVTAAITALAFVLAGLAGLVHEATTAHVRCAEHGEMIDSAIEAGAPTVASQRDSVVQSLPTTSTHGHEHCMLVSASRAARLEARPLTLVQLPFVATPIAAALAVRGPHGSALYRTAPKTSPPA